MKKLTKNEVILRFNSIHNNKYDYSLVEYKNTSTKIKIICGIHGIFKQTPNGHLSGRGCRKCYFESRQSNTNEFIQKSNKIHNHKYNYSLVEYHGNKIKIKIICPKHGIFIQEPRSHLSGMECQICGGNNKITNDIFIKRSDKIHNHKYGYSLVNVINSRSKVKIICPKHGIFEQVVDSHMRNHGCPKCKDSKGEKLIQWHLDKQRINFETQKTFDGCVDKRKLKFDFYLIKYNLCIEFDGKHHFEEIEYGKEKLNDTIKKDKIKNKFCKLNNINLLRIKYTEIDTMYEKINNILKLTI